MGISSRTPVLRVSVASRPMTPASRQRPSRANTKQASVSSRNSDSVYTACRKNDSGPMAR